MFNCQCGPFQLIFCGVATELVPFALISRQMMLSTPTFLSAWA